MIRIVRATEEHLDEIVVITDQAKASMAALGFDQWQRGYPNRAVWEADIAEGMAYVALDDRGVAGMFRYADEPELAYETLEGAWLTDGPYATIHRCAVASDRRGQGIIGELFTFAYQKAREEGMVSVRVDTHHDNAPMRRALEKFEFIPCGTITLLEGPESGGKRIAFEKTL